MFGLEVSFYALGFLTCLGLLTVIVEVLDREEKAQKKSKELTKEIKRQLKIKTNREESNIDID